MKKPRSHHRPPGTAESREIAAGYLDVEDWQRYCWAREDTCRRAPFLPYIRLFCAEICEKVRVATCSGRIYEKGMGVFYPLERSDRMRTEAREFLLGAKCEKLWSDLQAAGADLWPYSRFKRTLLEAISSHRQLGHDLARNPRLRGAA
jgi:hypothetical protein